MQAASLERAQDFIWKSARLIDRFRFAHAFAGGEAQPVVAALKAYQNPDGGFGNALEPDKRTPASQPVDVQVALEILDEVGVFDETMVQAACGWLASISTAEGGVPSSLPSVNPYPHMPWWEVGQDNPPAALNPTAAIVGLLAKHGVRHPWVERASAFCWSGIEGSETTEFHDLAPMIEFLAHAPDRARAERELGRIKRRIVDQGLAAMEVDAEGYVHKPLEWAPAPSSPCRELFEDGVIAKHLDALAASQGEDGGWPIFWPPLSAAVELEWRGVMTIRALKTLRAYGRGTPLP